MDENNEQRKRGKMSEKTFIQTLNAAFQVYDRQLNDLQAEIWLSLIRDAGITWGDATAAIKAHLTDPELGRYAPKPADIVRQCRGNDEDLAEIAWGRVVNAMRSKGAYTSVVFDDPRIMQAVQISGGWVAMCRSDLSQMVANRAAFRLAYKAADGKIYPATLKGLHDGPPVLIGDSEKCAQVQAKGKQIGTPDKQLAGTVQRELDKAIRAIAP